MSDEELYNLKLAKLDSMEPTIKSLPSPIIISDLNVVTTIEDTYVTYGSLGGTSEYIAFETKFNSMQEVADYVITNNKYEEVEITINANGNNGKTAATTQSVQFMNDSTVPTISTLPSTISTKDIPIASTYITYGESGGSEKYIIVGVDETFTTMTDLVAYAAEWLAQDNKFGVEISIKITATGNNQKIAESTQTLKFVLYTQLEYIKSTKTQYIKTGINATEKTVVEVDTVSEDDMSVFGAAGSGSNMFNLTGNTTRSFRWGTQRKNSTGYSCKERAKIVFGQKVYLNGELIIEYNPETFTTSEVYIFRRNNGDAGSCTIYYLKIYEDGTLIRNYVPCIRNEDSVIGMYDLVEGEFYTNSGTGNFIQGPEV